MKYLFIRKCDGLKLNLTRMHSSRMCTVRCSGRLIGGCLCLPRGWGCLPGGRGCLPGGVYTSSPRGQTDTCENITFPQLLLRTVKILFIHPKCKLLQSPPTEYAGNLTIPKIPQYVRQESVNASQQNCYCNILHKNVTFAQNEFLFAVSQCLCMNQQIVFFRFFVLTVHFSQKSKIIIKNQKTSPAIVH